MEAKTFFRFFPELTPIIKDSMEYLYLFFTLQVFNYCNAKQILFYQNPIYLIKYQHITSNTKY